MGGQSEQCPSNASPPHCQAFVLPLRGREGGAETHVAAVEIDIWCQTDIYLTNWLILTSVSQTKTLLKGRNKKESDI